MIDLEAFFCQNEIYDVKTIMSDQRLEGKLFFSCRPPSVWLWKKWSDQIWVLQINWKSGIGLSMGRRLSLRGDFANVKTLMGILVVWSLNFVSYERRLNLETSNLPILPIYFEVSKWVKFIGRSRRKSVPRVCPPNHKLERVPHLLDSQIITWVKPITIIRVGIIGKRTIYQESACLVVDWTVSFLCCH